MSAEDTVLVIGAGGRMGAALARRLARARRVIAFKRADLDVLHPERVGRALERLDFRAAVYTAGITSVDECESHPREAALSNAGTPRAIAALCADRGARLVHISTDYVFRGDNPSARRETDPAEPINVYGRTKLEGERAVLSASSDFLVARVSWLFGPDKPSFPDMILQRAMEADRVEAISDKLSCPTYSEDLASWIEILIGNPDARGLLHLCNSGAASWQAYGQTVLDIASSIGFPLRARTVHPVSRVGFPGFKALRPEFTAFDTAKFQALTGVVLRPWQNALDEYLRLRFSQR